MGIRWSEEELKEYLARQDKAPVRFCKNGHPRRGERHCLVCHRLADQRWVARTKGQSTEELRVRPWTRAEIQALKDYYATTPEADFNLSDLSQTINRSVSAIITKACKLGGLTKVGRFPSAKGIENRCKSQRRYSAEHPEESLKKGLNLASKRPAAPAAGLVHTPEVRSKISQRITARWKDPQAGWNKPEYRQLLSDQFSQRVRNPQRTFSRGTGGCRADLGGIYFRSSWEANYARYLNFLKDQGAIIKWEYEPITFWFHKIKRGTRSYTPDFKVWEISSIEAHYVEIKGWLDQRSKTRMGRMARYYPEVKLIFVGQKEYNEISKSVSSLIPNWEFKKRPRDKRRKP